MLANDVTLTSFLPQRYADAVDPGEHCSQRRALRARRVAVEHNLVVLKRAAYDSTLLKEGDEVEVVNFVGGGTCRLTIDD